MNLQDPNQIKEKIRQAEESVAGMQDENLKKIAFETVLASLLGQHKSSSNGHTVTEKKSPKKRRGLNKAGDKNRAVPDKTSTLKLTLEQLKELKTFYDKKAPTGTEEVVFTLAYFVHEKLKQSKFHASDVHLVYQNLISLKPVTKPPAMSLEEVRRAVRWLVAPSRRKQWLNDTGDGMFEISPQGTLRMTYEVETKKENGG